MSKEPTDGKLIFSNPPIKGSAFTPVMKKVSEVAAFAKSTPPKGVALSSASVPQVAVYVGPANAVISPSNPLIITGSLPVSVQFGTVTIEPGGQILVSTTADINIQTLIKQ